MFISFRGPIGCGKTSAAQHLVQKYGFVRVAFADPLKVEVFNFLWGQEMSLSPLWSRFCNESGHHEPILPYLNKGFDGSPNDLTDKQKVAWVNSYKAVLRPLLQWWGTEYRRAQDEAYWIMQSVLVLKKCIRDGKNIVMDDCRFENEMDVVENFGGKQVFIDCPKAEALALERNGGGAVGIAGHASEKLLDKDDPRNSTVISNENTLEDFLSLIDVAMRIWVHNEKAETSNQ